MKRVAVYIRISTNKQVTDLQQDECLAFVSGKGWSPPFIFEDKGISGSTSRRPQLDELMRRARAKEIDVIVIWKLDRFFRSIQHLANTINELQTLGVDLVAVKDQIDLTTSAGRLMVHMLGCFAQFSRELDIERIKSGLAAARARGVILGRKRTFDIQEVLKLRSQGLTMREISKQMGISFGSVQSTLKASNASIDHGIHSVGGSQNCDGTND